MSLFPKCTFHVRLPEGVVRAGDVLKGELIIDVPEPIPRAEHLDLVFSTLAWAGYGGGKTRSVVARNIIQLPMHVDFDRDKPLAAGRHSWPFSLDIPAYLPPNYSGADCAIGSKIHLHLDVGWAVDPKATLAPIIVLPPTATHGAPLTMRSPVDFHERIVVEVTLDSGVVAADQPVTGRIALRGGHDARFDALVVSLHSMATIAMSGRDRRLGSALSIRVPRNMLASGEDVPFAFPPNAQIPPTFRNGFIDHDVILRVAADIPWSSDPTFQTMIQILPAGSTVTPESPTVSVGAVRLRQLAAGMAAATGLVPGRLPVLVEGPIGPTYVRVTDSPRNGRVGVDVDIEFPDIDAGLILRPLGMLDGFRDSPLLPAAIASKYLLRTNPQGRTARSGRDRRLDSGGPDRFRARGRYPLFGPSPRWAFRARRRWPRPDESNCPVRDRSREVDCRCDLRAPLPADRAGVGRGLARDGRGAETRSSFRTCRRSTESCFAPVS